MDQFIGQLQQKMQEFRIGVLRVEDVDDASGKIILTVSEADAAMYQQKKCIRAALRFDSDNKNLSRFPVDFTGTSGEVFLLFLSGKPMFLCQRDRSGMVNISAVHMSHIETGYTKLSLPVLVDLACALGVRTDDLIFDKDTLGKDELLEEITLELDGCSKEQLLTLRQILSSSKEAIQKYLER